MKIGNWANVFGPKDISSEIRQLIKEDRVTHTKTMKKTVPLLLSWTCDPFYQLGNHTHYMALKATDTHCKHTWTFSRSCYRRGAAPSRPVEMVRGHFPCFGIDWQ